MAVAVLDSSGVTMVSIRSERARDAEVV